MNFRMPMVSLFIVCSLFFGISHAQDNRAVIIPLIGEERVEAGDVTCLSETTEHSLVGLGTHTVCILTGMTVEGIVTSQTDPYGCRVFRYENNAWSLGANGTVGINSINCCAICLD